MKKALKTAARGTVFPYAGEKWVVLEHDPAGRTLCLRLDLIPNKPFDENNCNNFATSSSKEWMNGPYLDNLIDAVKGPNAFLQTELDLTADDGLKDYGTCTVTIFSLTVDQYRRNRDVIPNADDWWWLSTAYSTASNGYEHSARSVRNDGSLGGDYAYSGGCGLLGIAAAQPLIQHIGRDLLPGQRFQRAGPRLGGVGALFRIRAGSTAVEGHLVLHHDIQLALAAAGGCLDHLSLIHI